MRHENRQQETWDIEVQVDWPEPDSDFDDEEFARAIAEGRRLEAAA